MGGLEEVEFGRDQQREICACASVELSPGSSTSGGAKCVSTRIQRLCDLPPH